MVTAKEYENIQQKWHCKIEVTYELTNKDPFLFAEDLPPWQWKPNIVHQTYSFLYYIPFEDQ